MYIDTSISLHLASFLISFLIISLAIGESRRACQKRVFLSIHRDVPEFVLQMLTFVSSVYDVELIAARDASVVRSFSRNIIT